MSICVDLTELLLLLEYRTVALLSHYNLSDLSNPSTIRSLVTRFLNQISWFDASKHDINSIAMVNEAMGVCLALHQ